MTGSITVSIWHNVNRDDAGRHTGLLGFSPGDHMVKVFTYTTALNSRTPQAVAEDAFPPFNHPPPQFYLTMPLTGRKGAPPAATIAAGAAQVARQERLRVTGDLYWVSAPMTALARNAAPVCLHGTCTRMTCPAAPGSWSSWLRS